MANEEFKGVERRRFPALVAVGLALAAVVTVVAFSVDAEYGVPVLILSLVCLGAAVGYRLLAGSNRDDSDHTDVIPKQPARFERPLGDTPEAHDTLTPHDVPKDSPVRAEVEHRGGVSGDGR